MAKKRYHQDMKDRHDESVGMYRYEDSRRMQEHRDGEMIKPDFNSMGHVPMGAHVKEYARMYNFMNESAPDTVRSVDNQIDRDGGKMRENFKPHKF